jgi:tripartite-type tricarboxylate transporter receptor subunit TctC
LTRNPTSPIRRRWLQLTTSLVLGAAVGTVCSTANAQTAAFPTKGLRLIVPYAVGGSTDQTARLLARSLSLRFGQPVVV